MVSLITMYYINLSFSQNERGIICLLWSDTLSPLLFNLAINLVIAYLSMSEDCGYSAQLHAADSIGLHPVEVPILCVMVRFSDDDSLPDDFRSDGIEKGDYLSL